MNNHQKNLMCGMAPFRAPGVCEGIYPDSIPAERTIDNFYSANEDTCIGLFRGLNLQAELFLMADFSKVPLGPAPFFRGPRVSAGRWIAVHCPTAFIMSM